MPDTRARVLHVAGDHYQMGYQQGQQAYDLRSAVLAAIDAREAQLEQDGADAAFSRLVEETRQLVEAADPAIVAMIRGLADALTIPFRRLFRYNLIAFLRDALTTRPAGPAEGCSSWAASGAATSNGEPILAKNRDYRLEHLPLQAVVRAQPEHGWRYTFVTSIGSPGVFVAGCNEVGLAIVDTHVLSRDVGPGLPAYALAMHLLEEQETVRAALRYLRSQPLLGRNNFLLADSSGDLALFEMGHRHAAVLEAEAGMLVNTNHFTSPLLRPFYVDTEPPALQGNSQQRYLKLQEMLAAARGTIDLAWAKETIASHDGSLAALCRHPSPLSDSSTIATVIFLPARRQMHFGHGPPCQAEYVTFSYE